MSDFAKEVERVLEGATEVEVPDFAIGTLKVNTDGFGGGDSTETALQMRFDGGAVTVRADADECGFRLLAYGDGELRVLIRLLKHAAIALEIEANERRH